MYRTVQMICDDNTSIFSTNPAFVTAYKNYVTNITKIISEATNDSVVTTGVAIDKSVARKNLCQTATDVAALVFAFATTTQNNTLRESINYSYTDLLRINDEFLVPTTTTIFNAANDNFTDVESFGVSRTVLDKLQKNIDDYNSSVTKPRKAISIKATHTRNLVQLEKQTDSILKNQLDKLVISFKADAPDFVSDYKNGRIIVDAPTSVTQIRGKVLNASDNSPSKNATVEIIGSSSLKTNTNIEGNFTFKPVTPGSYKINVTPEGSTETTTSSIEVKTGKAAKVQISIKAS